MKLDYGSYYARYHPETPEHDANLRALLHRWLSTHLPADRNAPILDVGRGRGYALRYLREAGYQSTSGIDRDFSQVEFARRQGLDVTQVEDSVAYLEGRPQRYQFVLLMDVLEHLACEQQLTLLAAIRRSLAPGGRLLCTVPNAASPIASYFRYADYTHEMAFTVASLELALTSAGWQVEQIVPAEFFFRPRYLFWLPTRRSLQYWAQVLHRLWWRFGYVAELGYAQGRRVPLSLNLLAVATGK